MAELVETLQDAVSCNRRHIINTDLSQHSSRPNISDACDYQVRQYPNAVILNAAPYLSSLR
jgi:hypothetical protein